MIRAYTISGMTCSGCTQVVHDLLSKVPGVDHVVVNLSGGQATIETHAPIEAEGECDSVCGMDQDQGR